MDLSECRCERTFEEHAAPISSVSLSADGRWVLSGSKDGLFRIWELDWELQAHDVTDWDDGALPIIGRFLTLQTPYSGTLPKDRDPTEPELISTLSRGGRPLWDSHDFEGLIDQLRYAGWGWFRPMGVRRELERLAQRKVIRSEYAMDEHVQARFLREIENSLVLDHRNVIVIHEAGSVDSIDEAGKEGQVLYYTMEYCNQGNLDELIKTRGPLPLEESIGLILQALEGLDYAHHVVLPVRTADGRIVRARGLVHRDIKPQNLFLHGGDDGVIVKIGDFGLAKAFETAGMSGMTGTGIGASGTPEFMPRQQVIDFKYAGPEVDVWAIAASLYTMLTGVPPRMPAEHQDRWGVVLNAAIPIREQNPSVPSRCAQVIDDALVDNPVIRVRTAKELKEMLETVL